MLTDKPDSEPWLLMTLPLVLEEVKPDPSILGTDLNISPMPKAQQESLPKTAKHGVLLEKHPPASHCCAWPVPLHKGGSWSTVLSVWRARTASAVLAEMQKTCLVHYGSVSQYEAWWGQDVFHWWRDLALLWSPVSWREFPALRQDHQSPLLSWAPSPSC